MAVITPDDVAAAIGRDIDTEAEITQVEQWISDVEMLIAARPGITLDDLDQPMLAYVEREVVVDWMIYRSKTAEADRDSRGVYLRAALDPWWALLSPETKAGAVTGSVRLTSALTR